MNAADITPRTAGKITSIIEIPKLAASIDAMIAAPMAAGNLGRLGFCAVYRVEHRLATQNVALFGIKLPDISRNLIRKQGPVC